MKAVLSLILLSFGAQASYFHEICSNSQATIQMGSGHIVPYFHYTARDYQNGGKKKVEITREDYNYTFSSKKIIRESSKCINHFSSVSKDYIKSVIITKKDNSKFPEGTIGVTEDSRTLEAILICDYHYNNRAICN